MSTRDKLIVYGGLAIFPVIVFPLPIVLIAAKFGYIDVKGWFFPPGGDAATACLRIGGLLVAGVALLVVVKCWARAMQRIVVSEVYFKRSDSDEQESP